MLTVNQIENEYRVSFSNLSKFNILVSKEIEKELSELASRPESNLTLNFSGIKFIDSSGFETLLNVYNTSKINNSDFKLVNLSEELVELVKLVELDQVFQLN